MRNKVFLLGVMLSLSISHAMAGYDHAYFLRQQNLLYSDSFHADLNSRNQKLFLDSLYDYVFLDHLVDEFDVERRVELVFLLYSKSFSYLKYRWQATIHHKIGQKDSIVLNRIQLMYPMLIEDNSCALDSTIYHFIEINLSKHRPSLLSSLETNREGKYYKYFSRVSVLMKKRKKFEDIKFGDYHQLCLAQEAVLRRINADMAKQ